MIDLKMSKRMKLKLIEKVDYISKHPKSKNEGGYGEPLAGDLKGLLKFRFMSDYRVVYKLEYDHATVIVLIVGMRKDNQIYKNVLKRVK